MEALVKMLESYRGRDAIIRTFSYGSTALTGIFRGQSAIKLGTISTQLANCRVMLRLFDDLSMLAYNMYNGFGLKEKTPILRFFAFWESVSLQLYFPVEHIAWAADNNLISIGSAPWWLLGLALWAISLLVGILRSFIKVVYLRQKQAKLRKEAKDAVLQGSRDESQTSDTQQSLRELKTQEKMEVLTILKNGADMLMAITWMPEGFLWAQKFSGAQVGLFGTISSLIGLYKYVAIQKPKTA